MTTTENFTGADASGIDGAANRVITLSNTALTVTEGFQVFVGGLNQQVTADYTVSHISSSTLVTLLADTFNDSLITVFYSTILAPASVPASAAIPLDARFIQKNIGHVGNTCTVTQISIATGTDEYRTVTETPTANADIPCFVQVLSYEDEQVRQGNARSGDLTFWFDASYESILARSGDDKVRITWNAGEYEVKDIKPFKAVGDQLMLIECVAEQV